MNSSGMKTAISEKVSDTTVKPISRAPSSAACSGFLPLSILRTMFSIITMASSTMKPVPIVSAISDRLSRLKRQSHMIPNVAMIDSGNATAAMMVARTVRRNSSTTSTTRPALSASVNCTSSIEARIVVVRSLTIWNWMFAGIERWMRGISIRNRSIVCTMLAPGCFCTSRMTAGLPLYQPPTRTFSRPSITSATSFSRTGAPLRVVTTMPL